MMDIHFMSAHLKEFKNKLLLFKRNRAKLENRIDHDRDTDSDQYMVTEKKEINYESMAHPITTSSGTIKARKKLKIEREYEN